MEFISGEWEDTKKVKIIERSIVKIDKDRQHKSEIID